VSKNNVLTVRNLRSTTIIAVTLLSFLFTITQSSEIALAITRSELNDIIFLSSAADDNTELSKNSYNNSNAIVTYNMTKHSSEKIIHQGVISSSPEMLQGHEGHQAVLILPPRNDSSVYSGIITFTANKPVEVQIYHIYEIDNHTDTYKQLAQTISAPFGDDMITTSLIRPSYESSPLFSASVPFTGDALGLHTTSGEPFLAIYTVSGETDKVEIVNNIKENQTANGVSSSEEEEVETQAAPQEYHPTSPNLLGQALTLLAPDIIAQLPLNDLPQDELVTMSRSIPVDKFANILNQLPVDKRDEILNQLPVDKRDEILNQLQLKQ
jgi:hypothetical protein